MASSESSGSRTSLQRQLSDTALSTSLSKSRMFEREAVEFSVKGPVSIKLDDEQLIHPGASLLDIIFSAPSEIGEIMFRNYYTAWLSLLVRYDCATASDSKTKDAPWMLAIPRKVLMPSPHREHGAQDCFSISVTESTVPWKNVVAMRIVLRQASPLWRVFHIEELNVYTDMPRLSARPSVSHLPHLHDVYYDHLKRLRYQTVSAMFWNPLSKPDLKKPPKVIVPKSPTKQELKKMTDVQREIAAKVKARLALKAKYDDLLLKFNGRYEIEPKGAQIWFVVKISGSRNTITISAKEI